MVSVKFLIGTAAAVMVSTAAFAADMPQPLPPQPYQPPLMVMAQPEGAWYLRGDIGVGIIERRQRRRICKIRSTAATFPSATRRWATPRSSCGGIGYEWNNWLRFDVTGEYRTQDSGQLLRHLHVRLAQTAIRIKAFCNPWSFSANAYVDLGTWDCLTPFVGVGVGGAWNKFADLTDIGVRHGGKRLRPRQQQRKFRPGRFMPALPTK